MMLLRNCKADEQCRQEGEDICLEESHEKFEAVHEYHKQNRGRGYPYRLEDEDETDEAEHNDMTRCNICKESDHECEGF